jgi:hypothetical protein
VKPLKPDETVHETAGQACETDETGANNKKIIKVLNFLLKLLRFHRFHTPATRFHSRFHPVSTVSHACHRNRCELNGFARLLCKNPMAATVSTNCENPVWRMSWRPWLAGLDGPGHGLLAG